MLFLEGFLRIDDEPLNFDLVPNPEMCKMRQKIIASMP